MRDWPSQVVARRSPFQVVARRSRSWLVPIRPGRVVARLRTSTRPCRRPGRARDASRRHGRSIGHRGGRTAPGAIHGRLPTGETRPWIGGFDEVRPVCSAATGRRLTTGWSMAGWSSSAHSVSANRTLRPGWTRWFARTGTRRVLYMRPLAAENEAKTKAPHRMACRARSLLLRSGWMNGVEAQGAPRVLLPLAPHGRPGLAGLLSGPIRRALGPDRGQSAPGAGLRVPGLGVHPEMGPGAGRGGAPTPEGRP
jgi:hypothetical protein